MHRAKQRATTQHFRWQSIAALLRLGLHRFWLQALPSDSHLPDLLLEEARALLGCHSSADWKRLHRTVERCWPPDDGILSRLIKDYDLSLEETFLLTLLGEVERSHLISLVVRELQAPSTQVRPTVHLCSALIEALFDSDITPLNIADSALVQAKIIHIEGEGPLPLRSLSLSAEFWSVLLEQSQLVWPQCQLMPAGNPLLLPDQVRQQLAAMADLLAAGSARSLIVRGQPNSGRQLLAHELAQQLGLRALSVPLDVWKACPEFAQACRYAGWLPVLQPKLGPGEIWRPEEFPQKMPVLILLGSDGAVESRDLIELNMPLPTEPQRRNIWQAALHHPALAAQCANALLSGPSIATIAANAKLLAQRAQQDISMHHITQARRQLGAERLRLLAQPVEREVDSDAVVLTPLVNEELERIISRAAQRESLWHDLGATLQQTATSGIRALFIGESGTGKTLAASYLATRIGAPLYRVDLSAVMNKYIGESEKNLSALLDMAAASDVILLFDEADSLFGKRSEGKETGERFANMLTHFLLTRIENHPGIVILTSNNRERIDDAFTRRLDLIVDFPMPGFEERLKLWSSHLGERGPGEVVYRLLASYCDFAGGQLRNVVITAAAEAADGKIASRHILTGIQAEYRKLGREMPSILNKLNHADHQGSE